MNSLFKLVSVVLLVVMTACSHSGKQEKLEVNPDCVYVCTGGHAKRYHADEGCMGLSRCSGPIVSMSVDDAQSRGLTPCRMCTKS
jgi:hypothetical protein